MSQKPTEIARDIVVAILAKTNSAIGTGSDPEKVAANIAAVYRAIHAEVLLCYNKDP